MRAGAGYITYSLSVHPPSSTANLKVTKTYYPVREIIVSFLVQVDEQGRNLTYKYSKTIFTNYNNKLINNFDIPTDQYGYIDEGYCIIGLLHSNVTDATSISFNF